jgi:hypothetical protein
MREQPMMTMPMRASSNRQARQTHPSIERGETGGV